MNKQECIERAERARHQARVRTASAALYAATFGGNSELAQKAFLDADVASEAARKWEWMASLHAKTRGSLLRKRELPVWMFGF